MDSLNISSQLQSSLPINTCKTISIIKDIADKNNYKIYLVGGFLRDLLMGSISNDIDIAIDGDYTLFTSKLSKELDATYKLHPQFLTSKIYYTNNNNSIIDIATTRTEVYKNPGAMPKVSLSSIKEDLYRRDFKINAMAAILNTKDFGLLYDPFNGIYDINKKIISILHSRSFIDDPTRILRALKFAGRLDFSIEHSTENLIFEAINLNVFSTISKNRIKRELDAIYLEPKVENILNLLKNFKINVLVK